MKNTFFYVCSQTEQNNVYVFLSERPKPFIETFLATLIVVVTLLHETLEVINLVMNLLKS